MLAKHIPSQKSNLNKIWAEELRCNILDMPAEERSKSRPVVEYECFYMNAGVEPLTFHCDYGHDHAFFLQNKHCIKHWWLLACYYSEMEIRLIKHGQNLQISCQEVWLSVWGTSGLSQTLLYCSEVV